jgi:transcriptional regulator with XRE-family HTH domain
MEIAKRLAEESAAQRWYLNLRNSSNTDLLAQFTRGAVGESSSTVPRHWIPQLLAGALLTSLVSPYISSSGEKGEHRHWHGLQEYDLDRSVPAKAQPAQTTPVARHIEDLEASLHLTKSQLAQALGVERATLYQWFRGVQPRPRTGERLEQLRQFAVEWNRAGLGSARAAWHLRVPGGQHTLGALLTQDLVNLDELRAHIQHVQHTPQAMELVEPKAADGFDADDRLEERRRSRALFPPTFSDSE